MDNLIGRKLDGRYLIESLIGVGGMANVYKGRDIRTGNEIAVKVLKEEFLGNEELVRRFKNESKAISILDHPNIVKVYDVSVTDQLQYIVMEYIDGITLKEYLKQRGGALTWKEVVHFATQVLSALEHAHSKGIVHRDVKPQNIMLQADGSIKMMDFGIARFSRAQSQTISDKAIGSVHYISPEQAKGDHTDARTDIYSVGVMLYEMLSGKLPFDGTGTVSIAIMQISEKPKPLAEVAPNVPEGLRQITEKAMEKDPSARYQSAAEMLAAIKAFKQNPSIRFEYEYNTQDSPSKTINKVVSGTKSGISTQQARRAGAPTAGGKGKGKGVRNTKSRAAVKEKSFSVLPIFFGMAVAFVIGAAILVYLIFTNSTNPLFSNRANVQLIDFVGMTEDEFRNSEYFTLLDPDIVQEYNSTYPAGTIFQQSPAAGRTVKEQQKITLKVSLGTEYITLPDVAGNDKDTAKQTLTDLGVSVVTKRETNDSVGEGTVIRTDPAAGNQVEGGSTVILYVAKPSVDTSVIVPAVEGLTEGEARSELRALNLVTKAVEQASDQPQGTVLSQNPSAGTETSINGVVVLYVSTGVPETPVVTPAPAVNGDPNTIIQEWDEDLGDGNWDHRYKTGDGSVYSSNSGFLYKEG
ncbi:Stk1 family PASTA domain-containing Ser/Thr kinase [Gemmiger formicilis]|uniref:Stk1 family PASTA domain-containing Ser/Thr kinase n=1 Tax=Gemmiger formicilis TaxID=745368 RepID=UPI00195879DA|nr:Stk1 family PASTA domain-containing Ser/Thr kinase [Gemmiger formicilis]MBM6715560.1 Stk1 family PASTA domain-containing Ser/Thr kinase [Gemmiger formicilis]